MNDSDKQTGDPMIDFMLDPDRAGDSTDPLTLAVLSDDEAALLLRLLTPRDAFLFGGTLEPFFLENATRWAVALRDAGAEVAISERVASQGATQWQGEFPLMVGWAFGR